MTDDRFRDLMAVVRWLQREGYRVGKSKVYKDRTDGLIRVQDDGTVLVDDARLYAANLKRKEVENVLDPSTIRRKAEAEARKAQADAERAEIQLRQLKGSLVPVEKLHEVRLDVWIATIRQIEQSIQTAAPEIIHITGGKAANEHALREWLEEWKNAILNGIAAMEPFTVQIGGNNGGPPP